MSGQISYSSINSIDYESTESFLERSSILLPALQRAECLFFELVTSGNVKAVHDFLNEYSDFNINCVNYQGLTALHAAIESHSYIMVEYLLQLSNINIGDSALHAIRENCPDMLIMILDKIGVDCESEGQFIETSDYPEYITPIMLAAQLGRYEIVELLLNRNHRLLKIHRPNCNCYICKKSLMSDDLLHAQNRRFNLYRAISNPVYICHTSDDPILTAFELAIELKECSKWYMEFRSAYLKLSEDVSRFAVDLIGCCRSAHEVEIILKQQGGIGRCGHFAFPRLILAIDYKQKEFVSHPNVQQVLETSWSGGWSEWDAYGLTMRTLLIIFRALLLPCYTITYIFGPGLSCSKKLALPVNKMISHIASYMVFLIIIFVQSNTNRISQRNTFGPMVTGVEPVLLLYILGFIWSSIRMALIQNPARYFQTLWNWYDLIMLTLFIFTFFFWISAYFNIQQNGTIDAERKYWRSLDPTLIAEGLFCIATIMAFFRLLFLCQLSYHLGPLHISLGKMCQDITKFIIIFSVIIISFTAGLCKLYQYYDGMVQVDPVSGLTTVQQKSFVNFPSTLKTLFWAIFCMSPIESADVVIENVESKIEGANIINRHLFTQAVGYVSFALFEVVSVVIMLNMLIATMSNTFQRVTDNVDIEWTFGRMQVYAKYMSETTLPPPLNLLPTYHGIKTVIEWIRLYFKPTFEKQATLSPSECFFIERNKNKSILKQYPVLMSQLVQRYFRNKQIKNMNSIEEFEMFKRELKDLKLVLNRVIR